MDVALTIVLSIVGTLAPFLLVCIAWMRSVSNKLQLLHIDLVTSVARTDAIISEHERRITRLEVVSDLAS